jgi:lysophospholipase L1-like esterase
MNPDTNQRSIAVFSLVLLLSTCSLAESKSKKHSDKREAWVGTWASSPQLVASADIPQGITFADVTLRQLVRVSVGGSRVRVRFSNTFGTAPLVLSAAHIAASLGGGSVKGSSGKELTFGGIPEVSIPPGALMISDPIDFDLPALGDVAVTVYIKDAPATVTAHPGSRTTSYIVPGNAVMQTELSKAVSADHWYFINGIDVTIESCPNSIVILGDSITDGRGSTTNGNDRWPDHLSRRLQQEKKTRSVGVLNQGIGGNCLLRNCLGPNALARFDRDVLAQTGVRWVILLEGVNDIGTRLKARETNESWATSEDIIGAYRQIVIRAHAHGIKVYGATLLPFGGSFYASGNTGRERQKVNDWIRTGGVFDGVIDFDVKLRDEKDPSRLAAVADGGDHLHPNAMGYKLMADAVDLALFEQQHCSSIH